MTHPAIILRVSVPAGVIIQGDSMVMHWQAKLFGAQEGEWHEVLRTVDGLVIDVSPVMLTEPPELEE